MKSKKSYIKRFMKALRENEREEYKDIEVQVILNGEHVLEGGNYVIGGNAKVSIPNPWDTNVLVVDHGELTTDGRNGEDPYVFADDHFDAAEVVASGACEIHAWRCSKVDARDNTTVYLYHDAECEPAEGGNVAVIKRSGNPWNYDDHR